MVKGDNKRREQKVGRGQLLVEVRVYPDHGH
jgi:hypothetical protein